MCEIRAEILALEADELASTFQVTKVSFEKSPKFFYFAVFPSVLETADVVSIRTHLPVDKSNLCHDRKTGVASNSRVGKGAPSYHLSVWFRS